MNHYLTAAVHQITKTSDIKNAKNTNLTITLEHLDTVIDTINTLRNSDTDLHKHWLALQNIKTNIVSTEEFSMLSKDSIIAHANNIKISLESSVHDWILETFKGPMKYLENADLAYNKLRNKAMDMKGTMRTTSREINVEHDAIVLGSHGIDSLYKTVEHARINNNIIYKDYINELSITLIDTYKKIIQASRNTAWIIIRKYLFAKFLGMAYLPTSMLVEIGKFKIASEHFRTRLVSIFSQAKIMGGGLHITSVHSNIFPRLSHETIGPILSFKGLNKTDAEKLINEIITTCDEFLQLLPKAKEQLTECRKATENAWIEDSKTNTGIIKAFQRLMHYIDAHHGKVLHTFDYYHIFVLAEHTATQLNAVLNTIEKA